LLRPRRDHKHIKAILFPRLRRFTDCVCQRLVYSAVVIVSLCMLLHITIAFPLSRKTTAYDITQSFVRVKRQLTL